MANLIPAGATYDNSGAYPFAVTPGQQYFVTLFAIGSGGNDGILDTGAGPIVAPATHVGYIAPFSPSVFHGTANALVTAILELPSVTITKMTDPQTLLAQAACYACYGEGSNHLLELALWSQWSNTVMFDPIVLAWANRAMANGGNPSNSSITTVNTFWTALKAAGIDSKMIHVNPIAPDDLPTARTPLLIGTPAGFSMWADPSTFLVPQQPPAPLFQGLRGDGARRNGSLWDTGVLPSQTSLGALNAGISIYVSVQEPDGTNHTHGGCNNGNANQFKFIYDFEFVAYNATPPNGFAATGSNNPWSGFATVNVEPSGPSWNVGVYGRVNHVLTYPTFTSVAITSGGGLTPLGNPVNLNTFGWLDCKGSFQEASAETLSFAAFHQGLTLAQGQALFNAVQAMRVAFGGGFV